MYELFKSELIINKIDIAFVSETWWKYTSIKNLKGYSLYHISSVDSVKEEAYVYLLIINL